MLSILESKEVLLFQKTLFQISSIFSNILFGSAYFSTSSQSNLPKIGKTKIVRTVTTIPITAYLIVFIAGLILSSFQPDRINNNHPHSIKTTENTQEANTNNEIANNIKSQNEIVSENKDQLCHKA